MEGTIPASTKNLGVTVGTGVSVGVSRVGVSVCGCVCLCLCAHFLQGGRWENTRFTTSPLALQSPKAGAGPCPPPARH